MKKYLKPTFVLAAASIGNPSSCLEQVDMELIADILGEGFVASKIFGMNEECETRVPIDFYCKYTSVESGAVQGFLS